MCHLLIEKFSCLEIEYLNCLQKLTRRNRDTLQSSCGNYKNIEKIKLNRLSMNVKYSHTSENASENENYCDELHVTLRSFKLKRNIISEEASENVWLLYQKRAKKWSF